MSRDVIKSQLLTVFSLEEIETFAQNLHFSQLVLSTIVGLN